MNYYISFGQVHIHSIAGKTIDKDCIAVIHAKDYQDAHAEALDIFGDKWARCFKRMPDMSFYPRGLIHI